MKAILIKSTEKSVRIINYKPNSKGKADALTYMHTLLNCNVISCVSTDDYDNQKLSLFVDDESLLTSGPKTFFYIPDIYPLPICGNGLILGLDVASGESISIPKALSDDLLSGACHVGFPNSDKVVQIERDIMNASAVKSKEAPLW